MTLGASFRFDDSLDTGNLTAANVNTLDVGANVYQSPNGGLNYRVTAATLQFFGPDGPSRFDFAAVGSDQVVGPSTTTFVYIDQAGVRQDNTTGFPVTPHIPLAEVASSASTITGITDRRPKLTLPGGVDASLWRTGRFYLQLAESPGGTITLTADTLYGIPFPVPGPVAIDRIAVDVTTAQAASSIRLGLYAESTVVRGEPGALLEDLGTIAGTSTGIKQIALGATRQLAAGRYFVAVISSDVLVAFRAFTTPNPLGFDGAVADFSGALSTSWRGTAAGNPAASALPSTFPATPTVVTGNQVASALRAA